MHAGTQPGPQLPLRRVRLRRLAIVLVAALGVLLLLPSRARAAEPTGHVDVVQVSGWIDPVVADFLERSIAASEKGDAEVLIIQLDSPGSLVSDARLGELVQRIEHASVPIAVWIGGPGAHAIRAAGRVATAAPLTGMAPKGRIEVGGHRLDPKQALAAHATQINERRAAVLGTFIASLDGKHAAGRTLHTATFTPQRNGPPKAELTVQARLAKLDLGPRMLHTVASPPVAYLLLLAGLALLVFEFFTGGVGIAGGVGAAALALAAYGLAVLPMSWTGLVLILVGFFGFAVDVQTGVPRVWTGIGVITLAIGSVVIYDDPVQLGWLPLVGGIIGVILMMLAGLPATVRSRFSTPTIGRESMIGEVGEAVAALDPEGVVRVREALWPARINRATPVAAGDRVKVVGIEGARLEVERTESAPD